MKIHTVAIRTLSKSYIRRNRRSELTNGNVKRLLVAIIHGEILRRNIMELDKKIKEYET